MNKACAGVDIIEISRIRDAVKRWDERFLQRIFTECELELYGHKLESLAVRFAGKEATIKALSSPGVALSWREIEILSSSDGKPMLNLYGRAQARAQELGLVELEISLSHSRENAVAVVFGIKE